MMIPWMLDLLVAAGLAAAPQQGDVFTTIRDDETELRYIGTEITNDEAASMLQHFVAARFAFVEFFGVDPGPQPVITVRLRQDTKRYYYTDGVNQVAIEFPNPALFRPVQKDDPRLHRIARPVTIQLWLYQILESTAGLDVRLQESLEEYLDFVIDLVTGRPVEPPEGPGRLWYQLDEFYGSGTTSFILNSIARERAPGHLVGDLLRRIAVEATEDERVVELFDAVTPSRPVYSAEEFEPGEPLVPGTTLRLSRMALVNGVRLVDQAGDVLPVADRTRDFDSLFALLIRLYPDADLAGSPPLLNGVDLWNCYFEFRPRVMRCRDNLDFYLVLRELLSRFHDRWLNIMSSHGAAYWQGVTGLSLEACADRVLVATVTAGSEAEAAGIRPGMEVQKVNGWDAAPLWEALTDYFESAGSCASPQESRARALNMLLTGAGNSTSRLVLAVPDQSDQPELEVELPCTGPRGPEEMQSPVSSLVREDGIAVIRMQSFAGNCATLFAQALDRFLREPPKGIVVDLRGNEGGDVIGALVVLGRLLDRNASIAYSIHRDPEKPEGTVVTEPVTVTSMAPVYQGEVAVLVDAWTAGPAELVALGIRATGRGPVVGTVTSGSATHPLLPPKAWQTLPSSGVTFSLTAHGFRDRDGSRLQGLGIAPTLLCEPTPQDVASGRDTVLETAAAALLE